MKKSYSFIFILCLGLFINACSNSTGGKSSGNDKVTISEEISNIDSLIEDTSNYIKGIYDIPELSVSPFPDKPCFLTFSNSEKIIDFDVSPAGMKVALIVEEKNEINFIKFWEIANPEISESIELPSQLKAKAIIWHPNAKIVFIMGVNDKKYEIFRVEKKIKGWQLNKIFSTTTKLRRLVAGPRPFVTYCEKRKNYFTYRLFFGMENGDNTFRIVSITENGKRFYQVVGPSRTFTTFKDADATPSSMEASWALPISFHPGGHQLIWEDENHNFFLANYDYEYWGESKPIKFSNIKDGTITMIPNGLGVLHWQKDRTGIGIYLLTTKKEEIQIPEYQFISTPSSGPDGKGIVGLTQSNGRYTLNYVPINIPLADVNNAWMFAKTSEEVNLFQKNYGLFRPGQNEQLYNLYESENYDCDNDYLRSAPTRPYIVTTDIFWEIFGAAYQGLFIVKERDEAIPNFWKFINEAYLYTKKSNGNSVWAPVFTTLKDFYEGEKKNEEIIKIQNEQDCISEITDTMYAFSDLKPRGHYTSKPEMIKYFKAFRYFTTIFKTKQENLIELNSLPQNIKVYAERWIESYSGFISPSRSKIVWTNLQKNVPPYCNYPGKGLTIFPLSWGFDNEILFSTVYHPFAPKDLQVKNQFQIREFPKGIEIAAVLGDSFAENLLKSDFEEYPPLRKVIENLKGNFKKNRNDPEQKNNLYNQWINALAVQWSDTVNSTNNDADKELWQTKRLQTGMATWATLRHATILVNESGAAECGEAGFEEILMRAPRGYVEPDPYTFATIADLFETAIQYLSKNRDEKSNPEGQNDAEKKSLYDGLVKRLQDAADEARKFQAMAEKERNGGELTNEENEKIFYVARIAEHLFLIFTSLSNPEYALIDPDPIAKIADVFGGGDFPYLMSAVGYPLEWNYIVPFYGRHEIVKGSVYSYYEFISPEILNDKEWREKAKTEEMLPWIKPFITYQSAENMANTGF